MPLMFIERAAGAITNEEWRQAVEAAGGRVIDGGLDVALRDDRGAWEVVLRWNGSGAEFSFMRYHEPFKTALSAIARCLDATIVDNDGARYL